MDGYVELLVECVPFPLTRKRAACTCVRGKLSSAVPLGINSVFSLHLYVPASALLQSTRCLHGIISTAKSFSGQNLVLQEPSQGLDGWFHPEEAVRGAWICGHGLCHLHVHRRSCRLPSRSGGSSKHPPGLPGL